MDTQSVAALVEENCRLLQQTRELVSRLTPDQYRDTHGAYEFSSIGQHVRHLADHYVTLLALTTPLDYDRRARHTPVEQCPEAAERRLIMLVENLWALVREQPAMDTPLRVRHTPDLANGEQPVTLESSLGRELSCIASHTLHHMAMITILSRLLGVRTEPGFGLARATREFRNRTHNQQGNHDYGSFEIVR
ncbi:MAG: hypothetical protein JJT90_09510 [Ectothiorhodospiraceae bacterium]|nr:hypothetical protein [Ectothiorhodospiraceae bacterium]